MSDSNVGNTNSENSTNGETSSSDKKPSLTSLTHKLKAEALRRYKIDDEVDNEARTQNRAQDGNVDSSKLKGQELNNQPQSDDVTEQEEAIEPKGNQESAGLSASDTVSSGNEKELLSGPTVEQGTDVAKSNEAHEKQNIASEKFEDTEATKSPNESLQVSDSINNQKIDSSDHHFVDSSNDKDTVPESSSVPTEGLELVEDKYRPLEGNRSDIISAVSANTITEVEDRKLGYSDKNEHFTQSSGENGPLQSNNNTTSYDNGSELIDGSSEIQLQSGNAVLSDQVNLIKSTSNIDDSSGTNTIEISEADKVMQSLDQDMGSGSAEFKDVMGNDHSVEISDNKMLEKAALTSEEINELETDLKSNVNNLTSSTEQNESNDENKGLEQNVTSNTSNIDARSFKGNK
jgi:hypothetical protein